VSTYTLLDAANILKVSPARLRRWKRTALINSEGEVAVAQATEPLVGPDFDFRDLVCVRAMLTLVDRGISVRRIRRAVSVLQENIPDLDDPLAALRLWSDGSERIVVKHEGVLIEPEGQMVLDFGPSAAGGDGAGLTSISEPLPKNALQTQDEIMSLFERGCSLDADPATYKEAMKAYEQCVELDPSFADAHCNLGAVLYNAGKAAPARRRFERCLEIDCRHVEAHFNLANLLEEEGCDEMALSHYRSALRSDPFYAELHVNMALLFERLSSHASSRDHWRRYLQLDPAGSWSEVARQRLRSDLPSG
jgi:tetratricopeptide (TPR) repeat protein